MQWQRISTGHFISSYNTIKLTPRSNTQGVDPKNTTNRPHTHRRYKKNKKNKKQLLLSTMASTLDTHKLRTVFFFILGNEQHTSTTQGKLMTPKRQRKNRTVFSEWSELWSEQTSTQQPNTNEKELCNHIDNRTYLFRLPYNQIKPPNTTNHRNSHNGNGLSSATSSMIPVHRASRN